MAGVRKIPMRQCTGCGEMKEKRTMIRVLKGEEGEILIDATGRKNGRGAYICRCAACLEKALKTKGLERSLKCEIPESVRDELRKEMAELE
ncbi:MAG: YlxR family protein [Lachnospiraceae bacterium]|nr:YlxR family protein [Lachnospiraceae bacterium]